MHIYIHKSQKYYNKRFCQNERQCSEQYLCFENNSRINPSTHVWCDMENHLQITGMCHGDDRQKHRPASPRRNRSAKSSPFCESRGL